MVPVGLASTNETNLFLLAGLPNPLHARIEVWLQALTGPSTKVIAVAGQSYDGEVYKKRTVQILLEGAARFAIRRLKNRSDDQSARPRRIVLFYVPAYDDAVLLDAFGFIVFPVPLRDLARYDDHGRQMRHRRDACETAIRKGIDIYKRELVGVVEKRVESRKSHEPLLLPPDNFHTGDKRVRHAFNELIRGARAWENVLPEGINPEVFHRERLPKFLSHQEMQTIYKDTRNVVFPCCRAYEAHGLTEFDHSARVEVLKDILQSTYRFGASLPPGFHHDAQLEGGRDFDATAFDCSRAGRIAVTGSHANIYPNDYIRPGN
ncbi:MAG: hypothetical protein U0Q16_38605 [Bryobacteraceae bacterium]